MKICSRPEFANGLRPAARACRPCARFGAGRNDAVSDAKPPPDEGPQDSVSPDQPSSDQPPLDHVPADEPPQDHVPPESSEEPRARENGIGEHLKSPDAWLRLLFMILFIVLWFISRFVVFAVMGLQVLFLLFSGKRNARLAAFGGQSGRLLLRSGGLPYPRQRRPAISVQRLA